MGHWGYYYALLWKYTAGDSSIIKLPYKVVPHSQLFTTIEY